MELLMSAEILAPVTGGGNRPQRMRDFYHVTTPEFAPVILTEGFKDHAAQKGIFDTVTWQFDPGVWLADVPPITVISVDQFLGHADEAWIAVQVSASGFNTHFRGNEWQDQSWPTRQWLVPAAVVNRFPRHEVPLVDVLRIRLTDNSTEHHRFQTAEHLREQILSEMSGAIQTKWLAALEQAGEAAPISERLGGQQ
jgi:hypothetical protein